MSNNFTEELKGSAEEVIAKVKQIIKEGNARRIIIKNGEGEVYMEFPLTIGVVGVVIAPIAAAIGALAASAVDFRVEIVKKSDEE